MRTPPLHSPFVLAVACGLALALLSSGARAEGDADKATARELATQGQQALDQKEYARASELFAKAYELVPVPTLALGRARADVGLGRLVAAHERYNTIVRSGVPSGAPEAFVQAFDAARAELEALKPRIPGLILRVRGTRAARIELDGEAYPEAALGVRRLVDPGRHLVRATSPGARPAEHAFEVREGGTAEVTMDLVVELSGAEASPRGSRSGASDEAASMSDLRLAGIVVGSVGLASLAASAVTGGLYWGARTTVDGGCDASGACNADGLAAASTAEAMGLASTITLFAGAAAAGVGTTLFVLGDEPEAPALEARAGLGFYGLSLRGAFQ
jgi:hypothetical protein